MSLRCIVLRISLCFFLAPGSPVFHRDARAQAPSVDIPAFYGHLKSENLLFEQIVLAQRLKNNLPANSPGSDSLSLDLAAAYLKLNMRDSCISNLKKIYFPSAMPENRRQLYFSSLMLTGQYEAAGKGAGMLQSPVFGTEMHTSLIILKRGNFLPDTLEKYNSSFARDLKNSYAVTPRYSSFWAGAFSAVLPGAGKWYIGYKRQAVTALIANLMFAAQAAESYSKAGPKSPQFIVTAGLFSIFYSGNIWGSVLAAKKKERDHLKQIDHEILDHYNTEFSKLSR